MPKITVSVGGKSRTVRYWMMGAHTFLSMKLVDEGIIQTYEYARGVLVAAKGVNQSTLKAVAKRLGA